ncbi:MAG: dienelactone hydrolase family protein [Candidatus Tectomicrobia bacterium]|nr:dienelactone hydrolase family protein [Candidatus Tectomicrobia bacterium]
MRGALITFRANGRTCDGYLSLPASLPAPAVIVIQGWWGLVDHIKGVTDRLAGEGFVGLAPDLYRGKRTSEPDDAERLMMALNIAQTEKDLRGAVQFLLDHEAVASARVGILGFCMGGQLALFAACANAGIRACVDFYGFHPKVQPDLAGLQAPVLGLFAENDEYIPLATVESLKSALRTHGKKATFHIYPGAMHGFFNDTSPRRYHPASAKDAWEKTLAFLRSHL